MSGNEKSGSRDLAKTSRAVADVLRSAVDAAANQIATGQTGISQTGISEAGISQMGVSSAGSAKEGQPVSEGAIAGSVSMEGLSMNQQRALESLMMGKSLLETSQRTGVARSTLYEWLKRDAVFRAAYNKWHEVMEESCRARLTTLLHKATTAVERALDAGDARCGMQLLRDTGMVKRRGKKITDPELLKRKAAVKEKKVMTELRRQEMYADLGSRPTVSFAELERG